jgi:hypothetical protein
LAGLAALAVALGGCGSGSVSVSPEAVAKAADTTTSAKSFRLTLHGAFSTPASGSFAISGGGVVDVSKRLADLTLQIPNLPTGLALGTGPLSFRELFVNNVLYVGFPNGLPGVANLPNGKKWIKFDVKAALAGKGINLSQLGGGLGGVDPSQYLSYLRGAGSVTKLGPATVGGVNTTHYHTVIDLKTVLNRLGNSSPAAKAGVQSLLKTAGNSKIPVDVWIDGQGLVRREQVAYAVPSGTASGTKLNFTVDLSDFGTAVSVTPPPASQVFDITTLAGLNPTQSSTQHGTATAPSPAPRHSGKRRNPSPRY